MCDVFAATYESRSEWMIFMDKKKEKQMDRIC